MKNRTFIGISIAAIIAMSAAVIVTNNRNDDQVPPGAGQKVFPGLINTINDVSAISIENADGKLSIIRYPDRWGEEQRDGYPVRADAVRKLLLEMTGLEQSDAKTRLKKYFDQLELRDIAEQGARSKKVTLLDKDGKTLAALLIGKRMRSLEGGSGIYIRKPDSNQSWLSRSSIAVSLQAVDWLEPMIVDIKPKQVQKIVIRQPDGKTLTVSKAAKSDKHYTVENMPPKATLKSAFVADTLASSLDGLKLDDVMTASAMTFSKDYTVNAKITTFDGLTVAIDVLELDGKYWIKLEASAKEGSDQAKEANKLNARVSNRAYQIAAFKATDLKKSLSDMLVK